MEGNEAQLCLPASDGSSTPGAPQIVGEQTIGDCAAAIPTPKSQPGPVVYTLQVRGWTRTQTGKEDVSQSWVLPTETSPTLAH